ncbi:MAG: hypothetical protein QM589_15680 [Thermomicrobiales bacterium]
MRIRVAALRKASGLTPAVRVPQTTHAKLQALAKSESRPMGDIVTELVDEYETRKFWDAVNASLDRLHADPAAWQDYMNEIGELQGAPNTELAAEPPYCIDENKEETCGGHARSSGR